MRGRWFPTARLGHPCLVHRKPATSLSCMDQSVLIRVPPVARLVRPAEEVHDEPRSRLICDVCRERPAGRDDFARLDASVCGACVGIRARRMRQ